MNNNQDGQQPAQAGANPSGNQNMPNQQQQSQVQGQGHGQGQTQGQGHGSQQGRISFQAIHQQAKQLLRQYTIEKAAAEKEGIATPEGRAHMMKADKIKAILVTYSKRQKLLQQQQQQKQQQAQQQQQDGALSGSAQNSANASNGGTPMLNMAGSPSMPMATPQPETRTISQQLSSIEASIINGNGNGNGNASNVGTPNMNVNASLNGTHTPGVNAGNAANAGGKYDSSMVQLTPAQQLQLKKQQLLNKYQQIITMSEQFKKNMVLIQKRLQEPNLDETQKQHLQEKEHEVKVRLENCKKCTHQIANQLKLAQQQATQLSQVNRSQTSSPQQQQQQQNRGPVLNNRAGPGASGALPGMGNMTFNNTTVNAQGYAGLSSADAVMLGVSSPVVGAPAGTSTMKLNSAAGTPGTPRGGAGAGAVGGGKANGNVNTVNSNKNAKKAAPMKKNAAKLDAGKRPADGDVGNANKKLKNTVNSSGQLSAATSAGTGASTAVIGASGSAADGYRSAGIGSSSSTAVDSMDRAKFQNLNIPDDLSVRSHNPVSVKMNNRPSQLGGNAMSNPSLTNPIMVRPPQVEIEGERVLNKRKLKELVASVASEEGEVEINIDGDVEELLLDLADEFVTSVTSFASRLARHRHSDNLDVRDVQLHLERNWNIRVPGYATDEIRMLRKFVPGSVHNAKINGVSINKSVDKAP